MQLYSLRAASTRPIQNSPRVAICNLSSLVLTEAYVTLVSPQRTGTWEPVERDRFTGSRDPSQSTLLTRSTARVTMFGYASAPYLPVAGRFHKSLVT